MGILDIKEAIEDFVTDTAVLSDDETYYHFVIDTDTTAKIFFDMATIKLDSGSNGVSLSFVPLSDSRQILNGTQRGVVKDNVLLQVKVFSEDTTTLYAIYDYINNLFGGKQIDSIVISLATVNPSSGYMQLNDGFFASALDFKIEKYN